VANIFTAIHKITAPFSVCSYSVRFCDLVYIVADFWELKLCCRISILSGEKNLLQFITTPVHIVNLITVLQIQFIIDDRYYLNTKKRIRVFAYLRILVTRPLVSVGRTLLCVRTSMYSSTGLPATVLCIPFQILSG